MKKKTILMAAVCVMLTAVLVVGGTLAYFTDTDTATNTFTVGNVKIDLKEQQTGETGLAAFDQDKTLTPGTSSDGSAVSKIVTVKNAGENDAWVWVDLKIPAYLVSADYKAEPHSDESKNALHWNSYGHFNVEYNAGDKYKQSAIDDGIINAAGNVLNANMVAVADGLWYDYKYVGTETIDDIEYVVLRTKMQKTLPAGETSLPCLRQVYMDWHIDTNAAGEYVLPDGTTLVTDASWQVIVNAYAIQANGLADIDAAIAAYSAA